MVQASRRKHHYIYKITRIKDGRYYIGMHSTDNMNDGYFGSGKKITRSIKKHGKEAHHKEILEYLPDRESLKKRERDLVNEECLKDSLCMNLQLGGGGGFCDDTHRQKFVTSRRTADLAGTEKASLISKKAAKTSRERGHLPWGGKHNSFLNKTHTTETKIRIGKANALLQSGVKNSQFGTCWVVKEDVKPVKIKKEQLDEYLANGYRRGRK